MKVTQHIEEAKEKHYSLRNYSAAKGKIQELYDNIDPLMEFKPPFIDVTTSREEFIMWIKATVYWTKTNQNASRNLREFVLPLQHL
jgi:hypothetical protein